MTIFYSIFKEGNEPDLIYKLGDLTINRTFDVPYVAGISTDNSTIYIDKYIPLKLNVKGKVIDIAKYISIHELTEKKLMDKGESYEPAHKQATAIEKSEILNDKIDWISYQSTINGYISKIKNKKNINPPPDLYLNPYIDMSVKDKAEFDILKRIRKNA